MQYKILFLITFHYPAIERLAEESTSCYNANDQELLHWLAVEYPETMALEI